MKTKPAIQLMIPVAVCSILFGAMGSYADDDTAPTPTPATSPATTGSAAPTSTTLQGGVQKVELSLEKLRDIGLDLKHVLRATSGLYDEVTIQPVSIVTQPEVIGRGIIINIPIATQPIGPPQPARKDRVDVAMSAITPVIDRMKQNVDKFVSGEVQLDLPQDVMTELKPQFDQWVTTVNSMASQEKNLVQLTAGPPYDNGAIADTCSGLQRTVKSLDKTRLAIYKTLKKEGKKLADAKKNS